MAAITIYSHLLFVGAITMLQIGGLALKRRFSLVTVFFSLLALSTAVYAGGYGFELTASTSHGIRFWSRFQFLGVAFIPTFLLLFILNFIEWRNIRRVLISGSLIAVSTAFIVFRWTNEFHFLYYAELRFLEIGSYLVLEYDSGPLYWVNAVYNVLSIFVGILCIGSFLKKGPKAYRRQGLLLLWGMLVPILLFVVRISGILPQFLDITPAALGIAAILFSIAVVRYQLFSLVPVGRERFIETMPDAVFVLDTQNRVADANPAAVRAFSQDGRNPVGRLAAEVFPLIGERFRDNRHFEIEGRTWESTSSDIFVERGVRGGVLVVARDVTEREKLLKQLEKCATEDELTGLMNRYSWSEAAGLELARLARHNRFASVIYIDLDHFKEVNDKFGHAAGDSILQTVGRKLKDNLRRPDLVGRFGGEEFVVFLPESGPRDARDVAERLRRDIMEATEAEGSTGINVTGSFGVVGYPIDDKVRLDHLISQADKAMYASKRAGRNKVSLAEECLSEG